MKKYKSQSPSVSVPQPKNVKTKVRAPTPLSKSVNSKGPETYRSTKENKVSKNSCPRRTKTGKPKPAHSTQCEKVPTGILSPSPYRSPPFALNSRAHSSHSPGPALKDLNENELAAAEIQDNLISKLFAPTTSSTASTLTTNSSKYRLPPQTTPTSILQYQLRKKLLNDNFKMVQDMSMLPKSKSLAQATAQSWTTVHQNRSILLDMIGPNWKRSPKVQKKNPSSQRSKILFNCISDEGLDDIDFKGSENPEKIFVDPGKGTANHSLRNSLNTIDTVTTSKITKSTKSIEKADPIPADSFPSLSDTRIRSFLYNRMISSNLQNLKEIRQQENENQEISSINQHRNKSPCNPCKNVSFQKPRRRAKSHSRLTPPNCLLEQHDYIRFQKPLQEFQRWVEQQTKLKFKDVPEHVKNISTDLDDHDTTDANIASSRKKSKKVDPSSCSKERKPSNTSPAFNLEDELKRIIIKSIHDESAEMLETIDFIQSNSIGLRKQPRKRQSCSCCSNRALHSRSGNDKNETETDDGTQLISKERKKIKRKILTPTPRPSLVLLEQEGNYSNSENDSEDALSTISSMKAEPGGFSHPFVPKHFFGGPEITPKSNASDVKATRLDTFNSAPGRRIRLSELAATKLVETNLKCAEKLRLQQKSIEDFQHHQSQSQSEGEEDQVRIVGIGDHDHDERRSHRTKSTRSTTDTTQTTTSGTDTGTGLNVSITVSDADTATDVDAGRDLDLNLGLEDNPLTHAAFVFKTTQHQGTDSRYWSTENIVNWAINSSYGQHPIDTDIVGTGTSSRFDDSDLKNNGRSISVEQSQTSAPSFSTSHRPSVRLTDSEFLLMASIHQLDSEVDPDCTVNMEIKLEEGQGQPEEDANYDDQQNKKFETSVGPGPGPVKCMLGDPHHRKTGIVSDPKTVLPVSAAKPVPVPVSTQANTGTTALKESELPQLQSVSAVGEFVGQSYSKGLDFDATESCTNILHSKPVCHGHLSCLKSNLLVQDEEMELIPLAPLKDVIQDLKMGNREIREHQYSASVNWTESVRPRKRRQKCQRRVSFSDPVALYKMSPAQDTETPTDSVLELRLELDRILRNEKIVFRYPQSQTGQKFQRRSQSPETLA